MKGLVVTFLATLITSILGQANITSQKADGSKKFTYFSDEAESEARVIEKYLTDLDEKIAKHVNVLLVSYFKAPGESNYTEIIQGCVKSLPNDYVEFLEEKVTELVVEIQKLDNKLLVNSVICFSLRVPEPEACKKTREEVTAALEDVASQCNLSILKTLQSFALSTAEAYISACVVRKVDKSSCY